MREVDPKPSQHGALGAPIRPKVEPPQPKWIPCPGSKTHERNDTTGEIRLRSGS